MSALALGLASALSAGAALTLLCLRASSQRHRLGLPEQTPGWRWLYAIAGLALLAISLAATVAVDGLSFGSVLWLCQAGLLALLITCLLPYLLPAIMPAKPR